MPDVIDATLPRGLQLEAEKEAAHEAARRHLVGLVRRRVDPLPRHGLMILV